MLWLGLKVYERREEVSRHDMLRVLPTTSAAVVHIRVAIVADSVIWTKGAHRFGGCLA